MVAAPPGIRSRPNTPRPCPDERQTSAVQAVPGGVATGREYPPAANCAICYHRQHWEMNMQKRLGFLAGMGLAAAFTTVSFGAQAQTALTGTGSSAQENAMEGVLVTLRKDGATFTTTVVSDDKGAYRFPTDRIEPGKYTIAVRAVGYELASARTVDIPAGGNAKADLKLAKTRNLAAQLSSGELLMSAPGSDREKSFMLGCTSCHTLQRVFTMPHSAEEWE